MFHSWFRRTQRLLKRKSPRSARCPQQRSRLGLEALEDRLAPATFTVVNTDDSGPGSLRQAILDSNANGTPGQVNLIQFNESQPFVPGHAFTIKLASPLPAVTAPVVIDGYTQKPAGPNTTDPNSSTQFNSAFIVMELDGSAAGANADGITVSADNSIVRGLAINGFSEAGIVVGGNNDLVSGDFIGTDTTGTIARGNGVGVLITGANDHIGTSNLGDRNFISGNGSGIVVNGATAASIQNNGIGVDTSGVKGLGNTNLGVEVVAGTGALIGGRGTNEGNIIAGNGLLTLGSGVVISASNTTVQGNKIGEAADPNNPAKGLGNGLDGIRVQASNVLIGGPDDGDANSIFFNGHNGVTVVGNVSGVRISTNEMLFNGALSIDLGDDGPTANHTPQLTSGPNNFQNFPVLTSAILTPVEAIVDGTLNSAPNTLYRIELFSSIGPGAGTGLLLAGFSTIRTDAQGNATFRFSIPLPTGAAAQADGLVFAATATAPDGSTSEFSPAIAGGAAKTDLGVTITNTVTSVTAGGLVSYSITITNSGPDGVFGATLRNVLPAALTNVTFTSVAANGALGNTASGQGAINDTLNLPSGGTVVYTVNATVAPDAQGVVTVTAVASDPPGTIDPAPGNNIATANITITPAVTVTPNVDPPTTLTGNERFVDQVFRDLLGRPADANALGGFGNLLDGGARRTQVVSLIQSSTEFRLKEVDGLYVQLLHRNADATAEQEFVDFLGQGGSLQQVENAILSSDEYFQVRGGNTNAGFLTALYQDVLGRTPDAAGLQSFSDFLANGGSRSQVALSIQTSLESDLRQVSSLFQTFLRRSPDAVGLAGFAAALQGGASEQQVEAVIIGSDEYLARFAS
jgi:uncharacterized repeat protein (TIGR01451 family)